jgi:hypothetical protein
LAQAIANDACEDVGRAAGREWHDKSDRPVRIDIGSDAVGSDAAENNCQRTDMFSAQTFPLRHRIRLVERFWTDWR